MTRGEQGLQARARGGGTGHRAGAGWGGARVRGRLERHGNLKCSAQREASAELGPPRRAHRCACNSPSGRPRVGNQRRETVSLETAQAHCRTPVRGARWPRPPAPQRGRRAECGHFRRSPAVSSMKQCPPLHLRALHVGLARPARDRAPREDEKVSRPCRGEHRLLDAGSGTTAGAGRTRRSGLAGGWHFIPRHRPAPPQRMVDRLEGVSLQPRNTLGARAAWVRAAAVRLQRFVRLGGDRRGQPDEVGRSAIMPIIAGEQHRVEQHTTAEGVRMMRPAAGEHAAEAVAGGMRRLPC